MRRRSHRLVRRVLVPLTGFLLVLGVPATGPAQAPGEGALKQRSAALEAASRQAVVELYALESRLAQARGDLARIDAQAAALAEQQAAAGLRYQAAQRTMKIAQLALGRQLRVLYEQDEPDPIAIVLGASSLDEAITGLENLSRTARATESVIAQARSARTLVRRAQRELAVRVDRTRAVRSRVAATAAGLEQARAERGAYLERLRHEQELTAAQLSTLERRAQEARRRARQITRQADAAPQATVAAPQTSAPPDSAAGPPQSAGTETSAAPSEPPAPPVESVSGTPAPAPRAAPAPVRPGSTMRVYATGYCLTGSTATGLPVGPGIVAVDPTVIPLGTRMTIPGYGEGVAADIGGAIKGARIDVWIASCKKAALFTQWVTVTFH